MRWAAKCILHDGEAPRCRRQVSSVSEHCLDRLGTRDDEAREARETYLDGDISPRITAMNINVTRMEQKDIR